MLTRLSGAEARGIRKGRRLHGTLKLTQERLARLFGVETRTVQRWEAGDVPIDARTALAFRFVEQATQEVLDRLWEEATGAPLAQAQTPGE
ncbi:helix-turn-helix domain-containing protein [Pedomonas sp.]|uniref:helix-turn-helix domain-containing protein n=1 Tax=Pedomonas sp. TaxID=2976421 RepID=UPI002F3F78C2